MNLILASSSPRRRELIARLGVPFDNVDPLGIDESLFQSGSGFLRSQALAEAKANWVVEHEMEARSLGEDPRVIGADTVISLVDKGNEEVIGKPRDREDAKRILRKLSGGTHRVITGVAVARPEGSILVEAEVTLVRFRQLSDGDIEAYVATGDAEGKAGAYGIQSEGGKLVEEIRGCYWNVVGLPIALLARMLGTELRNPCGCGQHELQRGEEGCRLRKAGEGAEKPN